jgi:DNA replicative helicase MCM subunit Mcm2 (Cdc46/Mcm family)
MIEDAGRVIDLVNYCLKTVYVDPETGKLDVDWVSADTTKTQSDRLKNQRSVFLRKNPCWNPTFCTF